VDTALRRPRARRPAIVLAVIGLVGAGAVWLAAGDFIAMRVQQAVADVQAAVAGDYDSDTGQRLARWSAAWAVFLDRPVTGAGMGGYTHAREAVGHGASGVSDDHAHSFFMHDLATAGAPGALLLLAIVGVSLYRANGDRRDHPYVDGTLYALVGWLIGAQFDCYQLAGNMLGLFTFIVALTLPHQASTR
jgi:O-antigen ligase